jgi:4a-hydroxytetrahydrobiopterin dehydratase
MALLTESQIAEALTGLPGWSREGDRVRKEIAFPSFPDAIAFLVRLAFQAEAADHHPDLTVHYRRVTVAYWTHSEGGLTAKDVEGARTVERLLSAGRPEGA